MRSNVAVWSWIALAGPLALACSGSAAPATTAADSGPAPAAGNGTAPPVATSPPGTSPPATTPPATTPPADGNDAASSAPPVVGPEAGVAPTPVPSQGSDAAAPRDAASTGTGRTADASTPVVSLLDAATNIDAGTPPTSAFTCTLLIGIEATEEWYIAGFETMVDNTRWELMWYHSGFVELWANPNDAVWATSITSPCAQNADKPDRVIFVALNYLNDTLAFWTPNVTAAVANIQAKYPSAKRIELMTFIRAPGNMACSQAPAPRSTITPAQDQAMAMVAAANPGLVFVSPQFEVKSCNEYSSNPPHPTAAGATAWATMMANYYR